MSIFSTSYALDVSDVTLSALSPCGIRVVTVSEEREVRICDTHTGNVVHLLKPFQEHVIMLAVSTSHLVTVSTHGVGRLWNLLTGEFVRVVDDDTGFVVVFSPDGKRLLTGSMQHYNARLWDVETGKCLKILEGRTCRVEQAFFTPQGDRVVTRERKGEVVVWDALQEQE